jgi:hypothetical protein
MSRRGRGKTEVVSFHDEAPDQSKYKKAIDRAKRGKDKPERMEGTARFDSSPDKTVAPPPGVVQKEEISGKTADGLRAVQEATAREAERQEAERAEAIHDPEEAEYEPELSEEERIRQAVEDRLDPLDIGQYLMSGTLLQTVPVIPGKLVVRFRSVTALEEVYVDAQLSDANEKLTGRQFIRRQNEWALATHVHSLNETAWPSIFDGNGTVNDKSMEMRMKNVRKLPSAVFQMLVNQMSFFLDRINNALTLEALGNG